MTIRGAFLYLACTSVLVLDAARAQEPAQPAGGAADVPDVPVRTRHASFMPASFAGLPGWQDERLDGALSALRQSCTALRRKTAWEAPCRRAERLAETDGAALRGFFEQEFRLYQIRDPGGAASGTITGYYEAELNGSRTRGGPYVYPVHAVPDDLLYLDARTLGGAEAQTLRVRIEGRTVVPLAPADAAPGSGYRLDLGGVVPDIRTRRYRVRLDGDHVVPYFSRHEIERGLMTHARVIAWVDDPAALYSMQIQGSGKLHLPDGSVLRLAYGEQNGHPFTPTMAALPHWSNSQGRRRAVATRGLAALSGDQDEQDDAGDTGPDLSLRGAARPPARGSEAELDAMIAALMPGTPPPAPAGPAPREPSAPRTSGAWSAPVKPAVPNGDPSYVFFRTIPDTGAGPPGALGVPLTPGRSVAVDPRTTPLGMPVFISTGAPGSTDAMNRLMLAQDTGGAVQGAVRADYFWGPGAAAFARASRMNMEGRMWLLVPRDQQLGTPLRGAAGAGNAECLVPDPELCVE